MKVKIGENIFTVKIADNNFSRTQGMMKRTFTDEFNGMLFFMEDDTNCFWMKNCIIPLDIIFIENQTISKIHNNCQPCEDNECDSYCGRGKTILEVDGGTCRNLRIQKGDFVKFVFN